MARGSWLDKERVGGADLVGEGLDESPLATHVFQGTVLVRDRHAEAAEIQPGPGQDVVEECVEFLLPALHQQRQIEPVEPLVGEARVVDRRAERVADRVGDHAEKLGLGVDRSRGGRAL